MQLKSQEMRKLALDDHGDTDRCYGTYCKLYCFNLCIGGRTQ